MATGTHPAALAAPFAWAGDHLAADLGHGAIVLFTTRRGGVSSAPFDTLNLGLMTGDDPADVAANRAILRELVGRPVAHGRQVHGTTVERVTAPPPGDRPPRDADGQATALEDVAALVLTADCLAIALATPGAVAMVHAGWRGLAGGVVEEGVAAVRDLDTGGGPLTAAIGPAACGACYEVGDDVRAAFGHAPLGRPAPLDLKRIARDRLEAAGAAAVHDAGLCTMCGDEALFFSHRRDRGRTGRQAGVVWRSPSAA